MGSEIEIPYDGWYRVDAQLTAGPYPAGRTSANAAHRLRRLLGTGVDCVFDLTEEHEGYRYGDPLPGYRDLLMSIAAEEGRDVEYRRFGFEDMSVPDSELMSTILDNIDQAREWGRQIYVHCLGGVGRTGTVIGCWLARHGHAAGRDVGHKLDTLRAYRPGMDLASPQTGAQCRMVRQWERGR